MLNFEGGVIMLKDYEKEQFIPYTIIKQSVVNDKLSHAYLINANNYEKSFDFALSIAKYIFCHNHYECFLDKNCSGCNICSRVDNFNYSELKIISSDSMVIKKEQLLELQNEFNLSGVENNYRIYIIKDCDKMNKQASNCLLKFLEEPVPGVIAILLTNHFSNILPTIVSRCQILRLNNLSSCDKGNTLESFLVSSDNNGTFENDYSNEEKEKVLDNVLEFVSYFEENGLDFLIYLRKKWEFVISSRDNCIFAFFLLIQLYYDALKYKSSVKNYFFTEYIDDISSLSSKNSIKQLIDKLEVLQYGYDMLKCNLNINLLMDDIVIKMGDINGYS